MNFKHGLLLLLFSVVCYFPLFLHLDSEALYHWDEARNGINALEMIEHGNPLIRTYGGEPETWETKPPLLIWLQVISMKVVGLNELGVRLPSALAGLLTLFLLVRFFIKEFNDLPGGIFAGLTLLCTPAFAHFHVTRTGDHDALLVFFLTLIVLYFYKYLKSGLQRNHYLVIATTGVILGVLTKSIMGFIMLPGIVIYTFFNKQLFKFIGKRSFWLALLTAIFCIGAYYFGREQAQPGYLKLVWENELFPRFLNTAENHNYKVPESRFYYFNIIATKQFYYFSYAFPILCLLLFWKGKTAQKSFGLYVLTCALVFLILISLGTINGWYDAPIFPLLSIVLGLGLSVLFRLLMDYFRIVRQWQQVALGFVFVLICFGFSYSKAIQKSYLPKGNKDYYGQFFKQLDKESKPPDLFVFYNWRNSSYLFYEKIYKDFKGWEIESCGFRGKIDRCDILPKPNQQVMICSAEIKRKFEKAYDFELVEEMKGCRLYRLKGE